MEFILVMIETANFKSDTMEELLEDRRRTAAWMTNLAQAGQLLNVEQFDTGHTRRLSVSAGPFAGEGERLAGYVIVKADHFEEAVEIAKTCDASGAIEVRALRVAM
jgi:hypothetical protein